MSQQELLVSRFPLVTNLSVPKWADSGALDGREPDFEMILPFASGRKDRWLWRGDVGRIKSNIYNTHQLLTEAGVYDYLASCAVYLRGLAWFVVPPEGQDMSPRGFILDVHFFAGAYKDHHFLFHPVWRKDRQSRRSEIKGYQMEVPTDTVIGLGFMFRDKEPKWRTGRYFLVGRSLTEPVETVSVYSGVIADKPQVTGIDLSNPNQAITQIHQELQSFLR